MFKSLAIVSLFTAFTAANAQSRSTADPQLAALQSTASQLTDQSQQAPIVRTGPAATYSAQTYSSNHSAIRQPRRRETQVVESQPVPGIWLRSEAQPGNQTAVETLSATSQRTEIRLDHGRLNVTLHQPAQRSEILVDLPGGQVSLLKDGLYTFNADTNTIRVLHGEAAAYPGPIAVNTNAKPLKIKEDHQLSLVATATNPGELKPVESYPYELTADLLRPAYADGPGDQYGDGYAFYPYSYYAGTWAYPGYGYYSYGYPFGYGIGFGYYGGFRGGFGYRGGFRR